MANVAIFRINYKSDFILTLSSDAGWMTPFCIKFWTAVPSIAYFVGFDGTTYTNCAPVDGEPTKLRVQFDNHGLPIGDLKFQIGYHFTVADFPTSIEDEVINQAAVIIDRDGTPMQVMLDFTGETAPEIEFSLPAYANEAQRIANEQVRIANEQQRIDHEEQRIHDEEVRIANEQQRIQNENARVSEFARLKRESESATTAANEAAGAADAAARLAAEKALLAEAAAQLANEKAQLAAAKAQLAADAAALANAKAALANEKAAYAKSQGDYAKQQGDISAADHRVAVQDHQTAASDHQTAVDDHTQAGTDHTQAGNDHTRAESDHTSAGEDHTRAGEDHTRAEIDHRTAADDHTQAGEDHTQAGNDHTRAGEDHTQAGNDHTRAGEDHTRAEADHAAVEVFVDSLGTFDLSKYNAVEGQLATYADLNAALTALASLPAQYKYGGMSIKFVNTSDNKYVQYRFLLSGSFTDAQFTNVDNWQNIIPDTDIIVDKGLNKTQSVINEEVSAFAFGTPERTIDIHDYDRIPGFINPNTKNWIANANYRSSIIELDKGSKFVLTANSTNHFRFLFLKSGEYTFGSAADISTIDDTVYTVEAGQSSQIMTVPADSGYIYIERSRGSGVDTTPSSMIVLANEAEIKQYLEQYYARKDEALLLQEQTINEDTQKIVRKNIGAAQDSVVENNTLILDELNGVEGYDYDFTSDKDKYVGFLVPSSNTWNPNSSMYSYVIDITGRDALSIFRNAENGALFAFLKDFKNINERITAERSSIYPVNIDVIDNYITINVPSDSKFLYVSGKTSTLNTPSRLHINSVKGTVFNGEKLSLVQAEYSFGRFKYINFQSLPTYVYEEIIKNRKTSDIYITDDLYMASVDNSVYSLGVVILNEDFTVNEIRYISGGKFTFDYDFCKQNRFVRLQVAKRDGTDFGVDETDFIEVQTLRDEFHTKVEGRNFLDRNRDVLPTVDACIQTHYDNPSKNNFFVVSDMHGDFLALDDVKATNDYLGSNKKLIILNCGDNAFGTPKVNGVLSPHVTRYMNYATQLGIYHTYGQHECGGFAYTGDSTGRLKANCLTHEEVFNIFTLPMRDLWGLPELDTLWYYKDFPAVTGTGGVRLICLYQFNIPLVDDENDNLYYKYKRSAVWYGTEQLSWLISTLNSVPNNYGVVILKHGAEQNVISANDNSAFYARPLSVDKYCDGTPVIDIVTAYMNRTTINHTYQGVTVAGIDYSDLEQSAVGDFTNAQGTFFHYLFGDSHMDCVGYYQGTHQRVINVTSSSDPIDCPKESNALSGNLSKNTLNAKDTSMFSVLGYIPSLSVVKLGRLGNNLSVYAQLRIMERVSLSEV